MAEREDDNLKRELGISRRQLLRRGAVVGGTLLWAAPAVQTIARPAVASPSPVRNTCCACGPPSVGKGPRVCAADDYDCQGCRDVCHGLGRPFVRRYT